MKKIVGILSIALALLCLAPAVASAERHGGHHGGHARVFIGGSVGFYGPFYDPWYDPWYGPYYGPYYSPYYRQYPYYPYAPPDYGYLRTNIEPNKAEVWVDGKNFGIAKNYDGPAHHLKLPLGEHTVQFRLKGYSTYTVSFNIVPDGVTTVEYYLEPLKEGATDKGDYGVLAIKASPPDAQVYVDSKPATGPSVELAPGRHEVRISKPGYIDYVADVMVSAGATVNLDAELRPAPAK